jgi:hypothetical protein
MTAKQIFTVVILVLGLVFSSLVRFTFNLQDGFVFHSWWINPLPLFNFAEDGSSMLNLTSTAAGYLFYIVAGLFFIKDVRENARWLLITLGYIFVTVYAVYFEMMAMLDDLQGKFSGQHLWAGPVLFLLGLLIYFKTMKLIAGKE